jgi:hypothetical protein
MDTLVGLLDWDWDWHLHGGVTTAFERAWNSVALASGVPVDWHNEGWISCIVEE